MVENPYESPAVEVSTLPESGARPKIASAGFGFLLFSIVSLVSFVALTLLIPGNWTAYWPGYVCAVVGIANGATVTYWAAAANLPQRLGVDSLIAIATTSFLLAVAVLTHLHSPHGAFSVLIPRSPDSMAPGHAILICSSLFGAASGASGFVCGHLRSLPMRRNLGGACCAVCVSHVCAFALQFAPPLT